MYEAVEALLRCHVSHLQEKANQEVDAQAIQDLAPDIQIRFPQYELQQVKNELKIQLRFSSGFPITGGTWEEEIKEIAYKRPWYYLKLIRQTVETIKYEGRISDNGTVPSTEKLLDGWKIQYEGSLSKIYAQISRWLVQQGDEVTTILKDSTNEVIDAYQSKLDSAYEEVTRGYEIKLDIWKPLQERSKVLAKDFSEF